MSTTKTALITGASRGIGKAIAYEFARNGYNLYLTCKTNFDLLKNLKTELENIQKFQTESKNLQTDSVIASSLECHIFQCNMGNATEVEQLFQAIPTLDVIVNNAGISHVGLLTDMSVEEWHHVISTNLDSLFYTSKFGVPKMLTNHKGKIINISSVWGNVGASMEVAYSTSKGGVNSFTKALAKELAPSNIQVNAIACGMIDTDMNSCLQGFPLLYSVNLLQKNRNSYRYQSYRRRRH